MRTYVLKSRPYLDYDSFGDGYYIGKTYFFQKEKYAVCHINIEEAKHYKHRKTAENACEKLLLSICNYVFDVVVIEDGKEIME